MAPMLCKPSVVNRAFEATEVVRLGDTQDVTGQREETSLVLVD
ncbi:hypothetical protein ACFY12_14905 [Streptomyces sp. NPDC001339]